MTGWLKEAWYQLGWSDEVAAGKPLVRTILELPVLAYRDSDGTVCALLDMCPHRFAPLSAGKIEGGTVTCGYHGLAFGPAGQCVHNPHGPVTSAMRVRSFPIVERHTALWVWMGETAPDPSSIPQLSFIDEAPESARIYGYMPTRADYRILVDNIMDLSHADYLHPETLGGMMVQSKASSREEGDSVIADWRAMECDPPPAFKASIPAGQKADITIEVVWAAPAVMKLTTCGVAAGTVPKPEDHGTTLHNMTPATAGFTHYFYCSTRQFLVDDQAFSDFLRATISRAFLEEDKPMIELQQERMGTSDLWDLSPILLPSDAAAVRVRRKLDSLLKAEQAGAASANAEPVGQ